LKSLFSLFPRLLGDINKSEATTAKAQIATPEMGAGMGGFFRLDQLPK